jgi:hypothetical protein
VYFGRVSFSIYLLHFPLLLSLGLRTAQFGQYLGMDHWLYALLALVVWFAVLLSLAEIFYRFVRPELAQRSTTGAPAAERWSKEDRSARFARKEAPQLILVSRHKKTILSCCIEPLSIRRYSGMTPIRLHMRQVQEQPSEYHAHESR